MAGDFGLGGYLARMRNQANGSGAPGAGSDTFTRAAGQASQLPDAPAMQPPQSFSQQFGDRLQQGLNNPLFQVGAGMLLGSQRGGAGPLAGALGGAMNFQALQLAQQQNALALRETEARLEGMKLKNHEQRQLAAGREQFASLQRQNPDASPADLLRLWSAMSGDPKAVSQWASVAQRDDQRQQLAGYRQQLLDERQRFHDLQIGQGQQRLDQGERSLGIRQAEADRRATNAGQPRQRALGSTRDVPLGGEQWQRQSLQADGTWAPLGQPYRRSSNPLAELLGGGGDQPQPSVSPSSPGIGAQEQVDRAQAAQLVQANPGLRNAIDQRLRSAYGRGL